MPELEPLPEDWERGLAVVAHPDDMEYGAAAAVARWTGQGKWVGYVLVSAGEAGIADLTPGDAGRVRRHEQHESCAAVGVDVVEFLGHPDGTIEEGLRLRADLTEALRRHRPEVVLSVNFRDSWGGPSWNHPDHRAVGRSLLDAVRDAGNPWVFADRGEPWDGVPESFEAGVRSLECHRVYLEYLGGDMARPDEVLRRAAEASGPRLGVPLATTFEVVG
jgi:LmbE family N-acetylglucosaminyl deacetylase